jgi:hypothetical protein
MEPIRKTAHSPPVGYLIGEHRYFTVAEGARIIGHDLICEASLWRYAQAGHVPFGLDLRVIRQPLLRTSPHKPRSDRQYRFLVREDSLLLLRDVFRECKDGKGNATDETLANMRDALVRRRPFRPKPAASPSPPITISSLT